MLFNFFQAILHYLALAEMKRLRFLERLDFTRGNVKITVDFTRVTKQIISNHYAIGFYICERIYSKITALHILLNVQKHQKWIRSDFMLKGCLRYEYLEIKFIINLTD